jgi:hypothetical protein
MFFLFFFVDFGPGLLGRIVDIVLGYGLGVRIGKISIISRLTD